MLHYCYFIEDRDITVNQPPVLLAQIFLAQEYKAK